MDDEDGDDDDVDGDDLAAAAAAAALMDAAVGRPYSLQEASLLWWISLQRKKRVSNRVLALFPPPSQL